MPRIWVDADATPRAVKEMLYRAASRTAVEVVFVANQHLSLPKTPQLSLVVVGKGFDVADEYIADMVEPGDLVITQDIPLAAACVEKGATALENRGEVIDETNAQARLQMRDFMESMRLAGDEQLGGPKAFSDKDKHRFAGALDRWLAGMGSRS